MHEHIPTTSSSRLCTSSSSHSHFPKVFAPEVDVFHQVKRIHVEQRLNQIVNRLNKTKVEKYPDLRQEREDRQKELRSRDKAAQLARQKEEKRVEQERRKKAQERDHAYDFMNDEETIAQASNQDRDSDFEDDFM
jgi:hypothetical protein